VGVEEGITLKLFKIFLPFITSRAFDHEKLIPFLQKLWVDAQPAQWEVAEYDASWTMGFMNTGNTVISLIYIRHKTRMPTKNELKEVINALPVKYWYSVEDFLPETNENKLRAILSSDV
jgi:hypothetical protein